MSTQAATGAGAASETGHADAYATGYGLSFAIVSVLSALLVVLKETNEETVLATMKAITGHHWVTHGLLDVILFVVIGMALAKGGRGSTMAADTLVKVVVAAIVVSGVIISGFYLAY